MELLLTQDNLFNIFSFCPMKAIRDLFLTCSHFLSLADKERLCLLFKNRISNRTIPGLSLQQVVNVLNSSYHPASIIRGHKSTAFLREGKMCVTRGVNELPFFPPVLDVILEDVVDVYATSEKHRQDLGDGFLALRKDCVVSVTLKGKNLDYRYPLLEGQLMQVVRLLLQQGDINNYYPLILNSDGVVFVVVFDFDVREETAVKVEHIPPISCLREERDKVLLIDVNNEAWEITAVIPDIVIENRTLM